MKNRITITKERVVKADKELWQTSLCLLESGKEKKVGYGHQFRASLVFTAFALEAYLNHVGSGLFKSWETIERKLAPQEKLILLCEHLKIDPDWSARPWQTIKELMNFRNAVAHGRGERLVEEYEDSVDDYEARFYEQPLTKWERYASAANAARARDDVEAIATQLHDKGGDSHPYPFSPGLESGSTGSANPIVTKQ